MISQHDAGSVLARLRRGPLPTSEATSCAADRNSLKVIIHRLRSQGYVIETVRDPEVKTIEGKVHGKAGRYVLKSEPPNERTVMTFPVPIEAARLVRQVADAAPDTCAGDVAFREATLALVDFALRFEAKALPEMTQIVAGEMREIRLEDPTLEPQSFDIIRLNGRVFVPEVIEIEDPFTVLHVAGNGQAMTVGQAEAIATSLEELDVEDAFAGETLSDGARFIRFLVDVVLTDEKRLEKYHDDLGAIASAIEDEGDRAYFGSTNDADLLKEIAEYLDERLYDREFANDPDDEPEIEGAAI